MKKPPLNFPPPNPLYDDMPDEIRQAYEVAEKVTAEAAEKEAKRVDDAITAAIEVRLGRKIEPRQMVGRLHRTIYLDGSEVMVLDGVAFMHIGPWKLMPLANGNYATREITHLKGGDDIVPN